MRHGDLSVGEWEEEMGRGCGIIQRLMGLFLALSLSLASPRPIAVCNVSLTHSFPLALALAPFEIPRIRL